LSGVFAGFDGYFSASDNCFENFCIHIKNLRKTAGLLWPATSLNKGIITIYYALEKLLSDFELSDKISVPFDIDFLQIVEKAPSRAYHLEKSAAGMKILCVRFEMVGKMVDAVSEKRYLHFGAAGVALVNRILSYNLALPIVVHYC